eukprot:13177634-Alexandrium_andersonii.AAC.1
MAPFRWTARRSPSAGLPPGAPEDSGRSQAPPVASLAPPAEPARGGAMSISKTLTPSTLEKLIVCRVS